MATPKSETPAAFSFAGITINVKKASPEAVTLDKAGDRSGLPPLQFGMIFSAYEEAALAGEIPEFFVPVSLYQARHDHHFDNVIKQPTKKKALTASDVKSKLRDELKAWKAGPKDAPASAELVKAREPLYLGFATRTGKEGIEGVAEPGVTVWMMVPKK